MQDQKKEFVQISTIKKPEGFKETLSTMEQSGKRKWLFPRKPKGNYTNKRRWVAYSLIAILFIVPFIKINKNPLLRLDVLNREFYIFGNIFYVQDFYIFALSMITFLVFIILFTVVWGRLFCGWICPQTVFLEMVFRPIEFLIDGDRNKAMKLSKQPWNAEKIKKRVLKYGIYFLISYLIAHTFLAYIIGYESLFLKMNEGILLNLDTFFGLLIFTGIFFFVFSWFREQACILVCPYGRLQSVLIDKKTVVVAYDHKRGETRSSFRKNEDRQAAGKGDCIDCKQCVVVCPTGIDIRNGSNQLECINCTACIDACDEVMEKIGLPKGLIRYATEDSIENNIPFKITTRAYAYSAVLGVLLIILTSFLLIRPKVESSFLRDQGSEFLQLKDKIENTYQYIFFNKTNFKQKLTIKIQTPKGGIVDYKGRDSIFVVEKNTKIEGEIGVIIPEKNLKYAKEKLTIAVYDSIGGLIETYETTFAGPSKQSF